MAKEVQQTKFLKPGKIVIILQGRYAGRKAVIAKNFDDAANDKSFPHAVVVGIDQYPKSVTKSMSLTAMKRRSKLTVFIKSVNYQHMMPTRHTLDMDFKGLIADKTSEDATQKKEAKKAIKKKFEAKYLKGAVPFLW
ncbi:predicted protein [Naegleria gruberi]|uniref:Predicted protein n=1 Tax=Naegleria gruberi TaxID=5762 RepID=D2VHB5_NAEGR|nr:uncharacterized protein NAEGRDRAFT_58185 [Naegleria gruberi]EFC43857.1 predicted protein [Naegleria gruberi]|eukprot:XP_002676601.1 predicted protein [Naegleria gruberi strain NEG-M]